MAIRFQQIELSGAGHDLYPTIAATGSGQLVQIQSSHGYLQLGSNNSSYAHFQTDRSNFYFNQQVKFDGSISGYGGDETASFASFIDSSDTNYFVNPNGSSSLYTPVTMSTNDTTLTFQDAGTNAFQIKTSTGDELYLGSNNNYQLQMTTSGNVNTQGDWRFGANFIKVGNSSTYNSDDGSWGSRFVVSSTVHARIDCAQDANSVRASWWTHTGQLYSSFGTVTSHGMYLMSHNSVRQQLQNGYSQEMGSYRAPIFYDSNDSAYYLNPASTSNLNDVEIVQLAIDGYMYHKGDTDTYLGFNEPDSIRFVAGNSERMIINTDGIQARELKGVRTNLATSEGWAETNAWSVGTQTGYYGGNFTINGSSDENNICYEEGPSPNGGSNSQRRQLMWKCSHNGSGNGADGGWNKTITQIDYNKSHISVIYIKRIADGNGNFYHGTSTCLNLSDGSTNGNPYFIAMGAQSLPLGIWCVSIGYLQANNDTAVSASHSFSGIYRLDTGERIIGATDYRLSASTTSQHRAFLYYSTNTATEVWMTAPGFYEVNGHEPNINELLMRPEDRVNELRADTNIRAPLYYDSNDTTYYLDPSSTGTSLNVRGEIQNPSVWINDGDNYNNYNENIRLFNPANNVSVIAFSASGTGGTPTTSILGYSDRFETRYQSQWQTRVYNGYAQAYGSYRAPLFYDTGNTSYYIDPDTTGDAVKIKGSIRIDSTHSGGNLFLYYQHSATDTANSGTLTGWVSEPGITYADAGIGANIHQSGPYYGRSINSGYGVYVNFKKTNGETLFKTTTATAGNSGGQGGTNMTIDASGNVIATTSSRAPIFYDQNDTNFYLNPASSSVLGGASFGSSISITGTVTASSDVVAYSDERLKTDIKTLDGSKVYNMRGVSFTKDDKKGSGVIAQELEKIAPELVNDDNEYKAVAYGNITGYLIEAIKDLKKEIEECKKQKCNCNGGTN